MAATEAASTLLTSQAERRYGLDGRPDSAQRSVSEQVLALLGCWHVIAASRGSISRSPQNATETFELADSRLVSTLRFERLNGSVATSRRRVFDTSAGGSDSLLTLLQTSFEIVVVDSMQAVVAEGSRIRVLSRSSEMPPRDFFKRVSLLREKGYDADDLRMVPARQV